MNGKKRWTWIAVGGVVLLAGLLVAGMAVIGRLAWQRGSVYQDPQGRYSIEIDPSWKQIETGGSYAQFKVPEPPLTMYILVLDSVAVEDAFARAFDILGFDPTLLEGDSVITLGDWYAYQDQDAEGIAYGLAGQIVREKAYVLVIRGDKPGVSPESANILRALSSMKIAGKVDVPLESYADVEALVQQEVERLAGSISIAVADRDEVVYTYAFGQANPAAGIPADTRTIYSFGSMTKVFTASALMQLVEQGRVDLDVWAGEYIPEFPERWNVTVRQLLDHSACMPDLPRLTNGLIAEPGGTFPSLEEVFITYVGESFEPVCEPGKTSAYANSHYLALARVIEEVSGEDYVAYMSEHLLAPLAAETITFQFVEPEGRYAKDQYPESLTRQLIADLNEFRGPGQEAMILQHGERFATLRDYQILPPWGGLRGMPGDVVHFLQMHMNGGRYQDTQILKPETVAAMQDMQLSTDGSPLGFGLSWRLGKDEHGSYYEHVGYGAGSESVMRSYPDLELGVVVMSNVRGYQRDRIIAGLVSAWINRR